jgi:Fur family transcriptional regulator, ferric uptake regulator
MNQNLLEKATEVLNQKLESMGLRKTQERYKILSEIYLTNDHFEIDELYQIILDKNYSISRATVYNVIELLVEMGLVIKHQFGIKHASRYEKAFGRKQHSHLICVDCNKVFEFCDPRLQHIQNTLEEYSNMEIKEHSLILYGKCQKESCGKQKSII